MSYINVRKLLNITIIINLLLDVQRNLCARHVCVSGSQYCEDCTGDLLAIFREYVIRLFTDNPTFQLVLSYKIAFPDV